MDRFVGKRLDGRYEIREVIGVGGMAVVYKAYDSIEDRIVAVKILKQEFASNEEFLRRFKNESKAIAVLSHPNIVKVFDVSFGDLIQYIVMEYIDGITLKQFIDQQGSLVWKDAVHFTIQILKGLQHAHDKGIVHRDVKPQNIMLLSDGTIKVTDFGIARFARSEQKTITDKAIGSVHYISPEQARGEATDEKADIYSVGVMLFEMLTGQLPFQAESAVSVAIMQLQSEPQLPRSINQSIPLGLEQITMHAMQKETQRRYQSSAEMLRDLEEFRRNPEMEFDYSYFVDDSPTKFINAEENSGSEVTEDEQKSPIIPILAGIAGAFIVAIIILSVIFLPKLFGSTGQTIECPNFVGKNFSELSTNEEYKNLNYDVTYEHNSDYETGIIFTQSPEAGRSIKSKQKISITVSMGPKTVTVPDVSTLDYAVASMNLKSEGFTVKTTYKQHDSIAVDRVISTSPAANSSIPEGSEVEIFVSLGAVIEYVNVPDVVNIPVEDAKAQIEQRGLTVGKVTEVDRTKPKG
ncbi:MAG: Stk1 family PASTA domain-containing Ser/Thr kinase, partial [Oscillospiraceae bacterium]|nr:Stk1 family PASTA domain-containing Ser/Thr kinase [Oscillospiraceae bacterium]